LQIHSCIIVVIENYSGCSSFHWSQKLLHLCYSISYLSVGTVSTLSISGLGKGGPQSQLWPFCPFSVALLMFKINKNCYINSDYYSRGLVANYSNIIKFNMCKIMWTFVLANSNEILLIIFLKIICCLSCDWTDFWTWPSCKTSCPPLLYIL